MRHPFRPGQTNSGMTGNQWGCCARPESEHPEWVVGERVTIRLKHDVRTSVERDGEVVSHTYAKGTTVVGAKRGTYEVMYVIDEWAKGNENWTMVEMPGYSWSTGERLSVSVPWHYAKEVA